MHEKGESIEVASPSVNNDNETETLYPESTEKSNLPPIEETKTEAVEEEKFAGLDAYLKEHQQKFEAQFDIVLDKSPADKLRVSAQ